MKIEDNIFIGIVIIINIFFSLYIVNKQEIELKRQQVERAPEVMKEQMNIPDPDEVIRKLQKEAKSAFD